MVRTTLAIILASTLSLSAYAGDVVEATPLQEAQTINTVDQNFYCDGSHHYRHNTKNNYNSCGDTYNYKRGGHYGYHGHNTRAFERMLINNPKYKEQVLKIESLRDSLYGERNVLKSLMQAAEPSAKDIRTQSQVVSQLRNKIQNEISALHVQLREDEEYAKYFN